MHGNKNNFFDGFRRKVIFRVLLFSFFKLFTQKAFSIAMHFGFALVNAKSFGNKILIQIILDYNHPFAEALEQHQKYQCRNEDEFHFGCKDSFKSIFCKKFLRYDFVSQGAIIFAAFF